jgi:DNA (cytosine-5)-methyltransferase 1
MLRVGSLFSGIGGFDKGLEDAGMKVIWQVEVNPFCQVILRKNFPHARLYDDVRQFPKEGVPEVDLVCGGDPCQENSLARIAATTTAPSLGAEFLRVVEALRPRFVLRENPTRSRSDAPWPWHSFRGGLERLGYAVLPFRLRSCCFGADHQRDRLFLLAEQAHPDRGAVRGQGRGETQGEERKGQERNRKRQRLRALPGAVGGGPQSGDHPRGVRGDDGLPKGVDRARMKALGNSVDPRAVEWIGRELLKAIKESE